MPISLPKKKSANVALSGVTASPQVVSGRPQRSGRFFTVKQLAARWQISERQVHRFIRNGALVAHRFGHSLRIAEDQVVLFELRSSDPSCQCLSAWNGNLERCG